MRGLAKERPERGLSIVTRDRPSAGRNELLVRVNVCGICGTDLAHYQWQSYARGHVALGRVLGHEFVGVVVEAGPDTKISVGARITADSDLGCGVCWFCRRGMWNNCDSQSRIGSHRDGGLAEYVVVPERSAIVIPEQMPDKFATLLEPFGAASHAVHVFPNLVGKAAAVIGPGPVGLLAGVMLRDAGCSPVLVSGLAEDSHRLEVAAKLGLDPGDAETLSRIAAELPGAGVDVVVDAVGNVGSLQQGVGLARFGGEISIVGVGGSGEFSPFSLVEKGLTVRGIWRRVPESWDRLLAVAQRHPEMSLIVDGEYRLDDFELAFKALEERRHVKTVIRLGD
ncbi:MAG: alcohol dehydrogenase catalytic domain-containing protein [Acidimicrobiales bacterium]